MNNDRQVAFRLPSALVEQIDAQVEDWSARTPGVRVTRADVVRALLVQGLADGTGAIQFSRASPDINIEEHAAVDLTEAVTPPPVSPKSVRPGGTGLTLVGEGWD